MSPSRSKAKDKKTAGKEAPKTSTKSGGPAGGYNPLLGTFHTLETTPVSTLPPVNSRFRDIDDTDDPTSNSVGIGVDFDCLSNNGSWSGESEDTKDKHSQTTASSRHDTSAVSGVGVDSEKREKIRQKNEKKHQRQKERRAQELHDRCCGFLMSRKLEALVQKLVAMGFTSERATLALIMNEGKVEESVAWLFESGEDSGDHNDNLDTGGGNLKVDISQELAQISEMEIKFKCSKQEVERTVVACEGDLQQTVENLTKLQKQESHSQPPPPPNPPTATGGKQAVQISPVTNTKVQTKRTLSSGALPIQKPDEKDVNYPPMAAPAGRLVAESGNKNIQLLKKAPPVAGPEKRWPVNGLSMSPSGSFSLASPPPLKHEILGNEFKGLQLGSVVMMQRPQSNSKQIPLQSPSPIPISTTSISMSMSMSMSMSPSSSSSPSSTHYPDWNLGQPMNLSNIPTTTTRGFNNNNNTTSYGNQFHYQNHRQLPPPPHQQYSPTPTLAAASSLGLFSGMGTGGAAPGGAHVDWNGDWSTQFDYTNIDWSLNRIPSPSSLRPNGMWMGSGGKVVGNGVHQHPVGVVGGGGGVVEVAGGGVGGGGGQREWSSPFEEKDLFSLPRKFVSSPTL